MAVMADWAAGWAVRPTAVASPMVIAPATAPSPPPLLAAISTAVRLQDGATPAADHPSRGLAPPVRPRDAVTTAAEYTASTMSTPRPTPRRPGAG